MAVSLPAAAPAATLPPPAHQAYYPALTGLRAVAAYLVFFLHFRPVALHEGWADRIIGQWYVGVGMFFVLSGFLIASRYQGSAQLTRPWLRQYLWKRVARIYPIFFLLNGQLLWHIYWPLKSATAANSLTLIALSQSLLRGFSRTLKFVGIPQAWSLTTEECFYLAAPLLFLAWRRWGRAGAVGFVLATVSIGLALTALCMGRPALHGLFGSYHHLFNYTFFGRVLEFVMGVALARWWAARPAQAAAPASRQWPWRTLAGVLLTSATVLALALIRTPTDWYDGLLLPQATVLNTVVFPAAMTVLLAGLLAERSWLRAGLATPLMQALGRSSYFFYLFHVGIFSIWWQGRFGWGHQIGWQFLATVVLSEIGYRLLEEPLRRWVLARTLGRTAAK
jgi:peptidoglycan/LPS O-acetylase OafA/YrhL